MKRVLLVDNGSLEPASTRQLRRVATELSARLGVCVEPVSLAHATKVRSEALDGRPAELLGEALVRVATEGVDELVIAPQFIGPSYAVGRQIPALLTEKLQAFSGVRATMAAPLFVDGERRLAEILAEQVRAAIVPGERPRVAVVDHGSPSRTVTAVREVVAAQARELLGEQVREVVACSMERREGAEFDFNEPLLARLLEREGWRDGELVVALLFIGPGKHAGPDGDVARIVAKARGGMTSRTRFTPVMGEHPRLVEILADRVREAWQQKWAGRRPAPE